MLHVFEHRYRFSRARFTGSVDGGARGVAGSQDACPNSIIWAENSCLTRIVCTRSYSTSSETHFFNANIGGTPIGYGVCHLVALLLSPQSGFGWVYIYIFLERRASEPYELAVNEIAVVRMRETKSTVGTMSSS